MSIPDAHYRLIQGSTDPMSSFCIRHVFRPNPGEELYSIIGSQGKTLLQSGWKLVEDDRRYIFIKKGGCDVCVTISELMCDVLFGLFTCRPCSAEKGDPPFSRDLSADARWHYAWKGYEIVVFSKEVPITVEPGE